MAEENNCDGGDRPSADELRDWLGIPTAVISDETNCIGVMDSSIRPVFGGRRFAGYATTIRTERIADGAPGRALEALGPGGVVVIDGSAHPDTAVWGGNLVATARRRGAVAVVVDGNVRDTNDLERSGLAIYSRSVTPAGLVWGGEVNVPVMCGGVEVKPGDLLIGDDDGVISVSRQDRKALLARCRERLQREAMHLAESGAARPTSREGER